MNSKQVNGGALQKETFTARLLLYMYVGAHPKKLAGFASISGIASGKSGVDVHPSPPCGDAPGGMVKQRGIRQSNQKELTQKGTNIKEEAVTMSVAAGAAQRSGAK